MTISVVTTALASAARTTSGTADIGAIPGETSELLIYIGITAVGGTSPSMTVTYQSSPDGVTYYDNVAGAAITTVSQQLIKIPTTTGRFGRLSYAITGTTPSLTFSTIVEAKRLT